MQPRSVFTVASGLCIIPVRGKAAYFICENLMLRFDHKINLPLLFRYPRRYPCKSGILCDIKVLQIPAFQIPDNLRPRIRLVFPAHVRALSFHCRIPL